MINQSNKNEDNKSWSKYFLEDLCKKFYREDLFTFETFPESLQDIKKPIYNLSENETDSLVKSVQDIGNYNNEYALLGIKYISCNSRSNKILNRNTYKNYINNAKNGYLTKKIIALFALKYLMILAQSFLTFFLIYPRHRCLYEYITDKNENYWYCGGKKCKVKKLDNLKDNVFILRIIYYL